MSYPSSSMPWERSFRNFNTETNTGFRIASDDKNLNSVGFHKSDENAGPPLPPRPNQQNNAGQFNMIGSHSGGNYNPYNSQFYSPHKNYGFNNRLYGSFGNFSGNDGWHGQFSEHLPLQAFQSIEAAVRAVSSISMMLESTYQAIFSSFQAVIGVADNLSQTKAHVAQVFSTLTIIKTFKKMLIKILQMLGIIKKLNDGEVESVWTSVTSEASKVFTEKDLKMARSSWPLVLFFTIIFGIPWLIWKLLNSFSKKKASKSWVTGQGEHYIAVALYNFTAANNKELSFSRSQVLKLAPKELQPNVRGWLLASNDGKSCGLVPANYIKITRREVGVSDKLNSTKSEASSTSQEKQNEAELPHHESRNK